MENSEKIQLVKKLTERAMEVSNGTFNELEKSCWMVVHEHIHGVFPSEYDIREIDEVLYLSVLDELKKIV